MIPIHSPRLQVFPKTLTTQQRFELLGNITISRALNILNKDKNFTQNYIQPKVYRFIDSYYAVKLSLGTGPGAIGPFLLLDTGSSYTWVQCEGCSPCFPLAADNFSHVRSTTFGTIDMNDPRCVPQVNFLFSCGFEVEYPGSSIRGLLATERFTFEDPSKQNGLVIYDNVVFGCAFVNNNIRFGSNLAHPNLIAGIFALSLRGPESFIKQFDTHIEGKFSYCITSTAESQLGESTMKFGHDIQLTPDEQSRLKSVLMHTPNMYHLYVNGISVDGKRVAIDPSVFELDESTLSKGFFVDTGAPISFLAPGAYDPLHEAVAKYFLDNYGWTPMAHGFMGLQLCYSAYPGKDQHFPTVVFHLRFNARQGGDDIDMVMDQSNMFHKFLNAQEFCMMIFRNNFGSHFSLFGAYQQANFKILFDIRDGLFSFVSTRCQEN